MPKLLILKIGFLLWGILLLGPFSLLGSSLQKVIIGRVEKITLPKYGISLVARIDTGAHTSSLHVTNHRVTKEGRDEYIEFETKGKGGDKFRIKTKIYQQSTIKSATGGSEKRYIIREEVKLGKVTKEININLNDRTELNYDFLLGRNFLRGDFLVDVSLSHVVGD